MAKDVVMPALGMAQETGLLMEWLKTEGESIVKGEPLMVVETDKATEEIEASASGILANVTASPGDVVPVGQVIALILAPGEEASTPSEPVVAAEAVNQASSPPDIGVADGTNRVSASPAPQASPLAARIAADHQVDLSLVRADGHRIRKADILAYIADQQEQRPAGMAGGRTPASPKARRLAAENNLDLAQVTGSGPDGAVLTNDIQNMLARLSLQQAEEIPGLSIAARAEEIEEIAMSRKWQIMVQRLGEAWHNIPHFYLKREVDAGQLIAWRESARQRAAEKITYTDLLVKLTASALKKHPRANASWLNNQIVANQGVHVGLAVAVDDGLMVPVIHQANELSLGQIARRRTELVIAAQEDRLSLADLEGGTFTISNLGMFGTDEFSAIVNPPQAAILAVGRIVDRVVPVNDQPGVRPMMTLTLSCDHRVIDGARGARFLETIAQWIEEPLALLD